MDLSPRPLPFDPAKLGGLSERLITSHHKNNYGTAVKRLNAIRQQLGALDWSAAPWFSINGLKREELIATNSMVLHELYFGSLGGDGQTMVPAMKLALEANFGTLERWRSEFVAMGKAMGGGTGWVMLTFMPRDGTLLNQWAADHTNALAGAIPILALDMYEHSYHIDFGAAVTDYVDAFMNNIDWASVYERYQLAVHGASEPFGADQDQLDGALVFDVRRAGMFEQAEAVIPGAGWRDPAKVAEWARNVPAGRDVVVYCVYGHEVGRSTAMRLRSQGVSARYLKGGIDGWQAAKRPLQPKEELLDAMTPGSPT